MKTNARWSGLAVLLLGACGSKLPDVDCSGAVPAYADVAALSKCATCHSTELSGGARRNAPSDVNYNTEAAASAKAEDAAEEVYGGDMPPSNAGFTLSDEEKQALYKWALCR